MSRKQRNTARKLTLKQVIDGIMEVIAAFPDLAADLPERLRTRGHWEKTFARRSARAAQMMEVLQELPAFTNQAPKKRTKAAWRKVFSKYMGHQQVPQILRGIDSHANFKPIDRAPIVYWRDAFGPDEVVQRVRPRESHDWLPNPHRGTTTFQRFQGDDTYPAWVTADTYGPVDFVENRSRTHLSPSLGTQKRGKFQINRSRTYLFPRENAKYVPRTTLTYCRWPWAWLEPVKGRFNWKIIDGTLRAARERGQTAQIRFQPFTIRVDAEKNPPKRAAMQASYNADEYGVPPARRSGRRPPGVSVNVPDWYWDTGAKWLDNGPVAPKEPDGNDPRWVRHFGDFVRAFAERYDGHPDLESIDVAYGGFWGEGGGNCNAKTAAKLLDIYLAGFRRTQLLTMLGTKGCAYAAKVAARTGRAIGWRADCFGDLHVGNHPAVPTDLSWNHTFDAYPKEIQLCGVKDAWKTAPVTMETCGNVATWAMAGYDFDRIISEGYNYHMSVFMPKNVFFPERVMDKLIEFDRKIGYRFVLRQMLLPIQAKGGGKIQVDAFTDNVGCAPIYRPYRVALRFTQGKKSQVVRFKADIRKWLPGHNWFREQIVFPRGFQRGEVKLAIGIVDPSGGLGTSDTDAPRVRFAIDAPTDAGWHPLTSMDVV